MMHGASPKKLCAICVICGKNARLVPWYLAPWYCGVYLPANAAHRQANSGKPKQQIAVGSPTPNSSRQQSLPVRGDTVRSVKSKKRKPSANRRRLPTLKLHCNRSVTSSTWDTTRTHTNAHSSPDSGRQRPDERIARHARGGSNSRESTPVRNTLAHGTPARNTLAHSAGPHSVGLHSAGPHSIGRHKGMVLLLHRSNQCHWEPWRVPVSEH